VRGGGEITEVVEPNNYGPNVFMTRELRRDKENEARHSDSWMKVKIVNKKDTRQKTY
jgi:hypothetical protein